MSSTCGHLAGIVDVPPPKDVCETCIKIGSEWLHLRQCLFCGLTGCCDESPNRHASRHAAEAGHPIARSAEPGEEWAWCYVDEVPFVPGPSGWQEIEA
jgi:ubiquitin-hydrolase Zn-finger-containing protein